MRQNFDMHLHTLNSDGELTAVAEQLISVVTISHNVGLNDTVSSTKR